ncbi:hypothetical protein ACFRU3_38980 [Streptomyces sp. NPDC056910]|uniref:hypothetical protein n=1 Tax=Streptomyces sp. NPDC056910 TaxID=3345964 RepID=UPI003676F33F
MPVPAQLPDANGVFGQVGKNCVPWTISRTTAGNTVVFREAGGTSRRVEAFTATGWSTSTC